MGFTNVHQEQIRCLNQSGGISYALKMVIMIIDLRVIMITLTYMVQIEATNSCSESEKGIVDF